MKPDLSAGPILLVDSEASFSKLLKMRLEGAGFRVVVASSGAEAIEKVSSDEPSLLILNSRLSDMAGLAAYKRIKEIPGFGETPVLFLAENEETAKQAEATGTDILQKPYDFKHLVSRIRWVIAGAGEARVAAVPGPKTAPTEFPHIDLAKASIDPSLVEKVPAKVVWLYKIMPVKIENNLITIAVGNPKEAFLREDLERILDLDVRIVLSSEEQIHEAIKKYYGVGTETIDKIFNKTNIEDLKIVEEGGGGDIEKFAQASSIISLVNQILIDANEKKSTDIHIEPFEGRMHLRYRIDGVLRDAKVSSNIVYLLPAIISRIKIMSDLNIVERRMPQDGRAKVKIKTDVYDLRVSTLPTPYGESMVIRILPTKMLFDLQGLGFRGKELEVMERLIKKPHGIIFVTGPTGSGKSTTLYAALSRIKRENPGTKIITIEDPIEYEIEGITQVQVNPEIQLTFAKALRSMLRHDPDIMMVGEVRDYETAEIAIRMALTGHLLFSTLHTNDSASGVARLLNLGVEPFLVASSVEAFIAQRLIRTVCKICAGKGCDECDRSGYKGRTGIYEILEVTTEIRKLITDRAAADIIKKVAVEQGMRTLGESGQEKIAEGLTTVEEVMRVTKIMD